MNQCPMHTLLGFERFSHGTLRELINRLRDGHRKYRSLVDYAFRLKALESPEPVMRRIAREIVDHVIDVRRLIYR